LPDGGGELGPRLDDEARFGRDAISREWGLCGGSRVAGVGAAARRINEGTGTAAATIILTEGVYAVNEPALFKPPNR
jgi:hypothetical protein